MLNFFLNMNNQELILYDVKGYLATITINRPEKAHAFTIEMLKALHSRLEEADKSKEVKCIIIKSTGKRFFSAGYDLSEIKGDPQNMSKITEWGRKVTYTMLYLNKCILCQVQGIAIGFGVLLVLASDLRIFADRSKAELYLRLPELEISAFPQTGATLLPLLAFGLSYAKHLLFSADRIGIKELENINFPTRIFPFDQLDSETRLFATKLTKYQKEFLFLPKAMLTIMNKAYIKSCLDMEDECGAVAYAGNKTMKELDDFIKNLYNKYP